MVRRLLPYAGLFAALLIIGTPVAAHFFMQEKGEERAFAAREIIVRLTLINNEIQRERAIVVAFGHSGAQEDDVEREIAATDEYRRMLLPQIEAIMQGGGVLEHRHGDLGAVAPALDRLGEIRDNARSGAASPYATFDAYTELANTISQAAAKLHTELSVTGRQQMLAAHLLMLTNRLARERDYGVAVLAEAAPEAEFVRARQANLAALDRLQTEIRRSHAAGPHGELLSPYLTDVLRLHPLAGNTRPAEGVDRVAAGYDWFNTMTVHIDAARLLHVRLLTSTTDSLAQQS